MAVYVLVPGRQLLGHRLWGFCEFGLTVLVFRGWSYEHLNETGLVAPKPERLWRQVFSMTLSSVLTEST